MEKHPQAEIEYAIQRKTSANINWIYYTKQTFEDFDKAVKMLNFFRKSSNNAQFRLVKTTHTTVVEPV